MFSIQAFQTTNIRNDQGLQQLRSDLQMFLPQFSLPPPTHVLYQYLPDPKRTALKMKERNFTLCQKKEWKLRAVSDN